MRSRRRWSRSAGSWPVDDHRPDQQVGEGLSLRVPEGPQEAHNGNDVQHVQQVAEEGVTCPHRSAVDLRDQRRAEHSLPPGLSRPPSRPPAVPAQPAERRQQENEPERHPEQGRPEQVGEQRLRQRLRTAGRQLHDPDVEQAVADPERDEGQTGRSDVQDEGSHAASPVRVRVDGHRGHPRRWRPRRHRSRRYGRVGPGMVGQRGSSGGDPRECRPGADAVERHHDGAE